MQPNLDLQILSVLERDGRLSFSALGDEIGLSKTPTWSRVRELENRGVIAGYHADIDPASIGLDLHAFVHVTIRTDVSGAFEAAVQNHAAVLECFTTAGDADYVLHVLVTNASALDALLRNELSRLPGVTRISTTVALNTIKRRGFVTDCAARAAPPITNKSRAGR